MLWQRATATKYIVMYLQILSLSILKLLGLSDQQSKTVKKKNPKQNKKTQQQFTFGTLELVNTGVFLLTNHNNPSKLMLIVFLFE